jgi:hypothetical protein
MAYDDPLDRYPNLDQPVIAPSAQTTRGPITAAAEAIANTPGVSQEFGGPSVGQGFNTAPIFGEGGALQKFANRDRIAAEAAAAAPRSAAPSGSPYEQAGGGPIRDNFGPGVAYDIPKPALTTVAAAPPVAPTLDTIRQQLAEYRARENQDAQGRTQAMAANAQYATAYNRDATAQRAAEVAAFRATNGADMVLATGNSEYDAQRAGILADANAKRTVAATTAADLVKAQAGVAGPPRNYIDEAGKLSNAQSIATTAGSRVTEANARATEAANRGELERAQAKGVSLTNEQHQKVLSLADKMGTAKTPEEAQKYERQILALSGKSGEDWGALHVAGEQRFENGLPAGKDPDSVLLYNKRTGEKQLLGGAAGRQAPGALDNATLKANAGNKEIYDGYIKRFGEEAAKKVLGK